MSKWDKHYIIFFNHIRPSQKHQLNISVTIHIFPGYLSVPTFLQSKNDQKWKSVDGWEGQKVGSDTRTDQLFTTFLVLALIKTYAAERLLQMHT